MSKTKIIVTLVMSTDLYSELKKLCTEKDLPISTYCRTILFDHVKASKELN